MHFELMPSPRLACSVKRDEGVCCAFLGRCEQNLGIQVEVGRAEVSQDRLNQIH